MNDYGRIGFMQGRLSEMVDGRIQAFPWATWADEFEKSQACGISLMEWTLDQERLYDNPLLTLSGQSQIRSLCSKHSISLPSLTGDCFMQAPFWKADTKLVKDLHNDFVAILEACYAVGIRMLVIPLVDNGRLDNFQQEDMLVDFLHNQVGRLRSYGVMIIFESDFEPRDLSRFIDRFPSDCFGINYDIGNSAALGFEPKDEFAEYGHRIANVHVKDRVLGGSTVPLGMGNAQFEVVFAELAKIGYRGNFILQTARAIDDRHAQILCHYRDMTQGWITQFESLNKNFYNEFTA